jgi:hypothetical protein
MRLLTALVQAGLLGVITWAVLRLLSECTGSQRRKPQQLQGRSIWRP